MMKLSEYRLPFRHDTSYAYGVGRIRALESRLLTRQDFTRLLAAEHIEAFFRLLAETDYGPLFSSVPDPAHFEEQLQSYLGDVLNLIDHLSKDPDITDVLKRRYDFLNLKVLIKAKVSAGRSEPVLSRLGTIEPAALTNIVAGEEPVGVPEYLRRAIAAAEGAVSRGGDPQRLDVAIDREMYADFLSVLGTSKVPFLWGWLEREIDLLNIKTFLRLAWTQEMVQLVRESLCEGGSLGLEFFRALQDEPQEGFSQRFAPTRYAKLVDEGISFLRTRGSFARLEQLTDGFFIAYLRRAALATFGVEPLMAYALLKEYEMKALRTAAVGIWNTISQDSIRERLPDVYI